VKVIDFGLAKLGTSGETQLQTVFGTPRYISPEQSRSATRIDHRSDVYSLGCILFELVTGRPPFDGDVRQLIERHQRAIPPRAASLVPQVSPALDDLIAEMLAKDPMERPQTMGAVQRALRFAAEVVTCPEVRRLPEAPPRPRSPSLGPLAASLAEAQAQVARPASLPRVRPPSLPAVTSIPSIEISISCAAPLRCSDGAAAPPEATPDRSDLPISDEGCAVSGELLIPASGPSLSPDFAATTARTSASVEHPAVIFGLCVLVIAVLAALAVATIA
jgi:serine/threonine-protein kinase